jgi:outer membrane lipoprotein SlyB
METILQTTPQTVIPLLYKAAAVSVIAAALTGVGVMTGVVPFKGNSPQTLAAQGFGSSVAPQAAPTNVLAAPPIAQPAPAVVAAPLPDPVVKPKLAKVIKKPVAEPTITASPVFNRPVAVSASGDTRYPDERNYPNDRAYPNERTNDRAYPNDRGYPNDSYPQGNSQSYPPVAQAPVKAFCNNCGTIENIREVTKPGDGSGLGAVGGAVGGAVLGRQFGNGRGKDLLSVLGAVGGGFAGHQIEKSVRSVKSYEVQVRMEDGSLRTVTSATQPNWRAGDRVKVDGGGISSAVS